MIIVGFGFGSGEGEGWLGWFGRRLVSAARLRGLVSLCSTARLDAEPRHPEVRMHYKYKGSVEVTARDKAG